MHRGLAEDTSPFLPFSAGIRSGGPLAGLTILVIEESQSSADALRQLCVLSGARVRRANSLAAAMRHLRTYRPTVLITEMDLPDGDGKNLIRRLDKSLPRVPAILGMSAFPDMQAEAMQAGADGFIQKPLTCVAPFQHAVSSALPAAMQQWKPLPVSEDRIAPDAHMLMDDIRHGLTLLDDTEDNQGFAYAAAFIYSVAVITNDAALCETAASLKNNPVTDSKELDRLKPLREMLRDRLRNHQFPALSDFLGATPSGRMM